MIPLYGFLEGDSIGLLILAYKQDTVRELADKLQQAASVRVSMRANMGVRYRDRMLDPNNTLEQVGIEALDRFDVVSTHAT